MSCILNRYRKNQNLLREGKITPQQFKDDAEKMKGEYGIRGFFLDGLITKSINMNSEVMERMKKEVLKIYPNAVIKVGEEGKFQIRAPNGEILLSEDIKRDSLTVGIEDCVIYATRDGISEETLVKADNPQGPFKLIDGPVADVFDMLAEKFYEIKF